MIRTLGLKAGRKFRVYRALSSGFGSERARGGAKLFKGLQVVRSWGEIILNYPRTT